MAETSYFQVRFGMVAVEKGFISGHQLVEATVTQVREDVEGKPHRPIGEILVELGYMRPSQVQVVLWEIANGRGEMETEGFKKRFGDCCREGIRDEEQLAEALKAQVMEEFEKGQHSLIGTILHDKGFMTFPQLQEVLESLQIMSRV